MVKKGQGALEFLMTYGWAFLVILIMIGALAYFGILDPNRFLPDRCDFGTQILCGKGQYEITTQDPMTVYAVLTNQFGGNIATYNWTMSTNLPIGTCAICFDDATPDGCAAGTNIDLDATAGPTGYIWQSGTSENFVMDCGGAASLPTGEKAKIQLQVPYYLVSAGKGFAKQTTGEIFAQVQ